MRLIVNGAEHDLTPPSHETLLTTLRERLDLTGTKLVCGRGECGACTVLLDGASVYSCLTLTAACDDREITTLEGLPARWAKQKGLAAADAEKTLHPVQQAWIEEQTPLCGFCQNGMMIKATELLESNATPTVAQIKAAFTTSGPSAHLCRCGSYTAIIEAVQRASTVMAKGGKA